MRRVILLRKAVSLMLSIATTLCSSRFCAAQKGHDPLSSAQVDQVRDLGDRPVDRLKLYLKFVNERAAAIKELTPNSTENSRPAELRARYEEFTRLADELSENIDTYDGDRADVRKALRLLWKTVRSGPLF